VRELSQNVNLSKTRWRSSCRVNEHDTRYLARATIGRSEGARFKKKFARRDLRLRLGRYKAPARTHPHIHRCDRPTLLFALAIPSLSIMDPIVISDSESSIIDLTSPPESPTSQSNLVPAPPPAPFELTLERKASILNDGCVSFPLLFPHAF
jgi:hypothetical protein